MLHMCLSPTLGHCSVTVGCSAAAHASRALLTGFRIDSSLASLLRNRGFRGCVTYFAPPCRLQLARNERCERPNARDRLEPPPLQSMRMPRHLVCGGGPRFPSPPQTPLVHLCYTHAVNTLYSLAQHGRRALWAFERPPELPEAYVGRSDPTTGPLGGEALAVTGQSASTPDPKLHSMRSNFFVGLQILQRSECWRTRFRIRGFPSRPRGPVPTTTR